MPAPVPPHILRQRRIAALGIALVALLMVVVLAVFCRPGLQDFFRWSIGALRDAGPLMFFGSMVVLPAFGFPLLPFSLAAGPVFGPTLGVGTTILCASLAVTANVALSYALASRWLRPWMLRLFDRLGYRLPDIPQSSAWQIVWLVRLLPGLPFWVQSYLLGVARVPLVPYLVVSTLLPSAYIGATIAGGDALMAGHTKHALLALAALGLLAAAVQLWRKRHHARPETPCP
jgi:uncharacterized membrane protein YdjX (TVP38/TMEM64 family)